MIDQVDENTNDGYHSFKELYEHRMVLTAALFNTWYITARHWDRPSIGYVWVKDICKSRVPIEEEPYFDPEWFIVWAMLPEGQVSYHYKMEYWDLFQIPEATTPPVWDGHSAQDVVNRFAALIKQTSDFFSD